MTLKPDFDIVLVGKVGVKFSKRKTRHVHNKCTEHADLSLFCGTSSHAVVNIFLYLLFPGNF